MACMTLVTSRAPVPVDFSSKEFLFKAGFARRYFPVEGISPRSGFCSKMSSPEGVFVDADFGRSHLIEDVFFDEVELM